ncbi:CIC11C00000004587 [Sungouiella intermedia]|uniref:CIC11C00000004587 n=1 Tax=Sungouiella intermedia TaxID=45354 RepID=A0A1L0BEL4_9ASCO|nr:CIC11C00000004587 [[Candida] intermedia]
MSTQFDNTHTNFYNEDTPPHGQVVSNDSIVKENDAYFKPEMVAKDFAKTYATPPPNGYQNFIAGLGKVFGLCGMFCFCCDNPYQTVNQGEVGLVQTFGALSRTVEPGLSYVNTWSEKLFRVNIKINTKELPPQSCFTRDNLSVSITSVVYYNIIDPQKAIFSISDIHSAIMERTQNTMRDVVGSRVLQDVVEKRDEIAESIAEIISKTAYTWGVHIESILIKDLTLPQSVRDSFAKAAEAKRIGEAKIINAKAEVESAKQMRKASDILSSPAALQIRYLDALQNMSRNPGTRVIFMPSADLIEKIVHLQGAHQGMNSIPEEVTPDNTGRQIANTILMQEAMRE